MGTDADWDRAEKALAEALMPRAWTGELPGEGAFYGPKIEFSLRDCIGGSGSWARYRSISPCRAAWMRSMSRRMDHADVPVMLHRAILGSFERFIGILIEHYEGALPVWLAPEQAVVMNITEKQDDYEKVQKSLQNKGFRVASDLRNEKIGFKIREHTIQRLPYLLVIGDKEVESQTVAVRSRRGEDLGSMDLEAFSRLLTEDVARHGRIAMENQH